MNSKQTGLCLFLLSASSAGKTVSWLNLIVDPLATMFRLIFLKQKVSYCLLQIEITNDKYLVLNWHQ